MCVCSVDFGSRVCVNVNTTDATTGVSEGTPKIMQLALGRRDFVCVRRHSSVKRLPPPYWRGGTCGLLRKFSVS